MSHWLIAGASRGIGLETARQLSARGERVTASARSAAGLAALKAAAPEAATLQFDVRDEAAIRAAAAQVCDPIDVLIANAGAYGPQRQSSLDMDFDGALDLLSINTLGPLRVVQAFLPLVKRSARPRIVMMSSRLGSMSLDGTFNVAYRVSKAGLNKIVQCLAADLKARGRRRRRHASGWVRTDMGGPNATLDVRDSVAGIIRVAESLTLADTRRYLDYRGEEHSLVRRPKRRTVALMLFRLRLSALRRQAHLAPGSRASPPSLDALRGVGTSSVATTCAGRGDNRNILSARSIASRRSCVTMSVVMRRSSMSRAIISRKSLASAASSETSGSSSSSRSGLTASARASATRRASPSDSSRGKCAACSVRPSSSMSAAMSASRACGAAMRILSMTLRQGSSRGSWKTMPRRPCSGRTIVPT